MNAMLSYRSSNYVRRASASNKKYYLSSSVLLAAEDGEASDIFQTEIGTAEDVALISCLNVLPIPFP